MDLEIKNLGNLGEWVAGQYLKNRGYAILNNHYTARWGEIDLVVQDQKEIVFVEVKSKSSKRFGMPVEAVTEQKLSRLIKTIHCYLQEERLNELKYRIDVISIIFSSFMPPAIQHFKNVIPFDEPNYTEDQAANFNLTLE